MKNTFMLNHVFIKTRITSFNYVKKKNKNNNVQEVSL